MEDKCFKLFACCIPVKGISRSIVCDLQRGNYEYIPNVLYDILTDCSNLLLQEIKEHFKNEFNSVIDSYFAFLVKNEFGFWCNKNEINDFPNIDLTWESPSKITNSIIDFNCKSSHDLSKICKELDLLGCKSLELRFYDCITISYLLEILAFFKQSRLQSISLVVKYDANINIKKIENLCFLNQRVRQIIFHSADSASIVNIEKTFTRVIFQTDIFDSELCCGAISHHYFRINIDLFTESQSFNTCLNKKISIDKVGNIKNCPSSTVSYGNINEVSLLDVILNQEFKSMWYIKKEQINSCQQCEFRFICTDCRMYLQDTSDIYSKPLKCGYDPYTCEWTENSL